MAYRGEDLDLRTPGGRQAREPYPVEAPQTMARGRSYGLNGNGRNEPTYVDDTVMACCNHAFDIAQAHGAAEVRLEHLIHAMTRVEAAAQVLEERGVRESHLRRESAALLAAQIPVGLGNTHAAPRASGELDDALRRASDIAARSGAAAGVEEMLWVMLNAFRDHPAVQLLARHAPDWQQWDWGYRGEARRAPVRAAAPIQPAVEAPPYYPDRRVATYVETPPRLRGDAVPLSPAPGYAPGYDIGGSRLDQLEATVRALQADLLAERRTTVELIRELQRDIKVTRGDPAAADSIERAIDGRLQELSRAATSLSDRLHGVEKAVANGAGDLGDLVTEQLVAVADQLRAVAPGSSAGGPALQTMLDERFQAVRQSVDQQGLVLTSAIAQLTEPVGERMRAVEQAVEKIKGESSQVWRALADRLGQIELASRTQADQIVQQSAAEKSELASAVGELGVRHQLLADSLEAWRADQAGNVSIVANRIELLEVASAQPVQILQQLQSDIQGLQRVTLADYDQNRRGFRYWLFGTEEVFARSWRDETRQVRDRLKQLSGGERKA